jgi:hypothetical protein
MKSGYWISVTVDELPVAFFTSKGACNPQIERGHVLSSADFCFPSLNLEYGRKLRSLILCDGLEARYLAISEPRRGKIKGLRDLLPPAYNWTKGIGEGHIVSMREDPLDRQRVSPRELIGRRVILVSYLAKIHLTPPSLALMSYVIGKHSDELIRFIGLNGFLEFYIIVAPNCLREFSIRATDLP